MPSKNISGDIEDMVDDFKMDNLHQRIITSTFLILFIIMTIFFFPNWLFCLVVMLFIGMALYEFFAMVLHKGIPVYRYFGTIIGILLPVVVCLKYGGMVPEAETFFIVFASLCVFVVQFTRRDNSQALTGISVTLLGILYISWFFSFMIKLRYLPNGAFLVSYLLLVTKMGDVGSYLIGARFGKHSLIPRISPNKTVEGTIGGLFFSMLTGIFAKGLLPHTTLLTVTMLGLSLGIFSQIGDLSESLIKRDCGVKDSGGYLPGLGGILDIVDSLLFTTPIFYFCIMTFL